MTAGHEVNVQKDSNVNLTATTADGKQAVVSVHVVSE